MAAALAEMCFGTSFGAQISIKSFKVRDDYVLFSETPSTFLVEVESEKVAKKLFAKVPYTILGKTTKSNEIIINGSKAIKADIGKLKKSWQKTMREVFNDES